MAKSSKIVNEVATIEVQDDTLNAIATAAPAEVKDDANEVVTVVLPHAHKTPTAIIVKKATYNLKTQSYDNGSVDGKERWFAKKDLNSFQLVDGKWQITAKKSYLAGKLIAFTETSN